MMNNTMTLFKNIKDNIKTNLHEIKEYRQLKNNGKKNSKHETYRRIKQPKGRMKRWLKNPFAQEFKNGKFQNNIYFDMSPLYKAWVYGRNIALYCIPAILFHGSLAMVLKISEVILMEEQTFNRGMWQMLFILYGTGTVFGLRRASDHMAYYNTNLITSKYNINQLVLRWMESGKDKINPKEFAVMEHMRQKYNKHILFPTVKELAIVKQMFADAKKSRNERRIDLETERSSRLDFYSRQEEHFAAKAIADLKQEKYGGHNEYTLLVKKYKNRTTPAYKGIVDDIMDMDNIDLDFDFDDDFDLK